MKAVLKNLKTYILNVLLFDNYSLKVLKLLWDYKHIPIFIDALNSEAGALISRDIGYNKKLKKMVKLKVPKPVAIILGLTYNKQYRLTTYLHELGHYEDRTNMKKLTLQELEVRAWEEAIKLSNKYNISIDYNTAQKALQSYKVSSVELKNLQDLNIPKEKNKKFYGN